MSRAIDLEPGSAVAHFNRGLLYSELGDFGGSLHDLRRAQELSPHSAAYNSALCLQLTLAGMPDEALQYCDWALAMEPEGLALDSRALANALADNREQAIRDYEALLVWLKGSAGEGCAEYYGSSRRSWLDALRQGENPFDEAALKQLRPRPALPADTPC